MRTSSVKENNKKGAENKNTNKNDPKSFLTAIPPLSPFEQQLVTLVNQHRVANGLPSLIAEARVTTAARTHNNLMQAAGVLSHQLPGELPLCQAGTNNDRFDAVGYPWLACGENIAVGYTTPESVMNAWIASPPHNANLLSPNFRDLGVAYNGAGNWWTQDFGNSNTPPQPVDGGTWTPVMPINHYRGNPAAIYQPSLAQTFVFVRTVSNRMAVLTLASGTLMSDVELDTLQFLTDAAPAVSSTRLHVFAKAADSILRTQVFAMNAWLPTWVNLGIALASKPSALGGTFAAQPSRIDVVLRGLDNKIYHGFTIDGIAWSSFTLLPSTDTFVFAPTLASSMADRLDLFTVGGASGTNLFHNVFVSGAWTGFVNLGGSLNSLVSVVTDRTIGRIDLFLRNTANALVRRTRPTLNSPWDPPLVLGNNFLGEPSAIPGYHVFIKGSADDALYTESNNSGIIRLGGVLTSSPSAVQSGASRIDVFFLQAGGMAFISRLS